MADKKSVGEVIEQVRRDGDAVFGMFRRIGRAIDALQGKEPPKTRRERAKKIDLEAEVVTEEEKPLGR